MVILHEIINNDTLNTICRYMVEGFAVLIKTDTQWGLMAINPNILYEIKQRPIEKKIVRLVGPNFKLGNLSEPQKMFIREFWPGPVTIIINGESYRLTNKKFINAIILKLGRMVYCTSANISGAEPINSIEEALIVFSRSLDKIIMIAPTKEDLSNTNDLANDLPPLPSTIVDIDYWYIVRKGQSYLEIVNFIANKIIPYYKKHAEEYNKFIDRLFPYTISDDVNYKDVPVVDLVLNTSPKVKKHRQEEFDKKFNHLINDDKKDK